MKERFSTVKIISIAALRNQDLINITAEIVGFVFPVYAMGMPRLVKEFVKKVEFIQPEHIFGVATNAGRVGCALVELKKMLEDKSYNLDATYSIKMPNNYNLFFNTPRKEKAKRILDKSEKKIEFMFKNIEKRMNHKVEKSNFFIRRILYPFLNPAFIKYVKGLDKYFRTTEKCNHCRTCQKVCPVENVIINENGIPEWQHHCEQCLACLHWCPTRAIEFEEKTVGKNRYHHPYIETNEIIASSEEA